MSNDADARSPSSGGGTPGLMPPGSHLSGDNLSEAGRKEIFLHIKKYSKFYLPPKKDIFNWKNFPINIFMPSFSIFEIVLIARN